MTLSQSALSDLLDAIRAGDGLDLAREAMRIISQELIDLEASQAIGAARYERTDARTTHRNGTRARLLSTKAGDVTLHIPKLREGSFFPSLLQPRRRIDQALWAVIMEAYVHGVSTRKVDDLVAALGIEAGVSKSEVSRICGELDTVVREFRERPLDHVRFPYLFLDATTAALARWAGSGAPSAPASCDLITTRPSHQHDRRSVHHGLPTCPFDTSHLGDPTVADAILDRLVHNSYRLELKGDSRRRATKATDETRDIDGAPDTPITPGSPATDAPGRPIRGRGGMDDPPRSPASPTPGGVPDYPQTTERR